jgi:hypothetical protein
MGKPDQMFRVAIRARGGRFGYQIYTVAGEPETIPGDADSYASVDEAVEAGYEAVAAIQGLRR